MEYQAHLVRRNGGLPYLGAAQSPDGGPFQDIVLGPFRVSGEKTDDLLPIGSVGPRAVVSQRIDGLDVVQDVRCPAGAVQLGLGDHPCKYLRHIWVI